MSKESVVGVWKLISVTAKSSEGLEVLPYGDDPAGMLLYDASGYMAGFLMRRGRPQFASGDPMAGTPEEIRQAFVGFEAYCGTYEVDMEKGIATHHVEISRFPNWEGTNLIRYINLSGDKLFISTPKIQALGHEWVLYLNWQRMA
jgi:hypothetical protein